MLVCAGAAVRGLVGQFASAVGPVTQPLFGANIRNLRTVTLYERGGGRRDGPLTRRRLRAARLLRPRRRVDAQQLGTRQPLDDRSEGLHLGVVDDPVVQAPALAALDELLADLVDAADEGDRHVTRL